jgi:uncharacterized membrane protein
MFKSAKSFLSKTENDEVIKSIQQNELNTSGEIRIFIEQQCSYVNPIDRAKELFLNLKMYETLHRNAVLIYIAYEDKDFALIGDNEIFKQASGHFWEIQSKLLAQSFHVKNYVEGIINCVNAVGQELHTHFPSTGELKNELPDEIMFGK